MPGALTHVVVGLLLAIGVHIIHLKLQYALSIFVGSLLPDIIKFGFTALKQLTFNIFAVTQDSFYQFLAKITSSYANWFTVGFFIFGTTLLLYNHHYIQKKKMEEYDELYMFLLAGIIVHLILDVLIIENGPWI